MERSDETRPQPDVDQRPGKIKDSGKKAYVTPSFEWEQAFETMALACGKINTTQAQCKFNRKHS